VSRIYPSLHEGSLEIVPLYNLVCSAHLCFFKRISGFLMRIFGFSMRISWKFMRISGSFYASVFL